jgi:hypothetical protein
MRTGANSGRGRRSWLVPTLVAVVALAALLVGPHVGRAIPSGAYRPVLAIDALASGCFPLPAGLTIDFPYQVRRDGDVGHGPRRHRRLVLQYDQVDPGTARARISAALRRAGLSPRAATVTAYARVPSDSVVRGQIVLRLPVTRRARDVADPGLCQDPSITKRFPASWPASTHYA